LTDVSFLGVITSSGDVGDGGGILFEIRRGGGEGIGGFLVCMCFGCVFLQDMQQFKSDK
jgi:hypothetical protein